MQTKLVLGIVGLIVIAGGAYLFTMDKNPAEVQLVQETNDPVTVESSDNANTLEEVPEQNSQENEDTQEDTQVVVDAALDVREEEITEDVNDTITAQLDYKNGTYKAQTTYALPNGGSHDMDITMTIQDDVVTSVNLVFDGDVSGGSTAIQSRFTDAMKPMVADVDVDSISLSRTGGASLTTAGFNKALAEIKVKAKG